MIFVWECHQKEKKKSFHSHSIKKALKLWKMIHFQLVIEILQYIYQTQSFWSRERFINLLVLSRFYSSVLKDKFLIWSKYIYICWYINIYLYMYFWKARQKLSRPLLVLLIPSTQLGIIHFQLLLKHANEYFCV